MDEEDDIRLGRLHLGKGWIDELDRRIISFFQEKRPFLQIGYTLKQMAKDIDAPLHHLSAFINHYYGVRFNDFINRYRIDYCISTFTETELKHKKIETIARELGFSNRNTFRMAFKKMTGMTPSGYLKEKKSDGDQT